MGDIYMTLNQLEIAARINGYLRRMKRKHVTVYKPRNFNKEGLWLVAWPRSKRSIYKGRFIDVVAKVVCDPRYFDEWIPNCVEQTSNCNNARILEYEPEPITTAARLDDVLVARALSSEFDKLINYI